MAQLVNGSLYQIIFGNTDQTNSITITLTGDTYSPSTIWTLAKGMISTVKQIWFSPSDTVKVVSIDAIGDATQIDDPSA